MIVCLFINALITWTSFTYFRIKANAAFLCNYEVMQVLQQLKDSTQKKHKREASLATVTYEVGTNLYTYWSVEEVEVWGQYTNKSE